MRKQSPLSLGRLFGIEIKLDYSWFVIFALIIWMLAGHYFPRAHPDWPVYEYVALGIATALMFFGSVLAHELAHSLVSKVHGVGVRDITLFIFGGVAHLSEEPKSARGEFLMALAGPAASLVLSGFFGLAWLFGQDISPQLHALAGWLAATNAVLALFNLIPGFPLDGGRIFRSAVWRFSGDRLQATRLATQVGRLVAYGFMVWGLWQVLAGDWANGLWIAFIGWFLKNAAAQSFQSALLQNLLAGHEVHEAMTTTPFLVKQFSLDSPDAREASARERRSCRLQKQAQDEPQTVPSGIEWDPTSQDHHKSKWTAETPWASLKAVTPDEDLSVAFQRMSAEDVNQLPVVEGGRLVGLLRRDTLLQYLRAHTHLELEVVQNSYRSSKKNW